MTYKDKIESLIKVSDFCESIGLERPRLCFWDNDYPYTDSHERLELITDGRRWEISIDCGLIFECLIKVKQEENDDVKFTDTNEYADL